jgi:hypothetical protein
VNSPALRAITGSYFLLCGAATCRDRQQRLALPAFGFVASTPTIGDIFGCSGVAAALARKVSGLSDIRDRSIRADLTDRDSRASRNRQRRICRSLMPITSAACHQVMRLAIARRITSCTWPAPRPLRVSLPGPLRAESFTASWSSSKRTSMISLCQQGKSSPDALGGARNKTLQVFSSRSCLSAVVPDIRTRHPFAVSAPAGFHRRLSL